MHMAKEEVMNILNTAQKAMGLLGKVQYVAEIQLSMPVGETNINVTDKIDILYEIDKSDKKAYIRTSRKSGSRVEISEFYYGDSASYVKFGNHWVKSIIAANQYNELFSKLELPGEKMLAGEGLQMETGDDVIILSSSVAAEQYAKAIFEKISPYNNSLTQNLNKGTITIEINKKSKQIEKVTLGAEGYFGENNRKQTFSEKSTLTVKELPADYKINLPAKAALSTLAAGIENLSLQDANALSNCSCSGCAACTACLACLVCIACIFPPLLAEAAATAILASTAAAVSISFGAAQAAQVN